MKTFRTLVVAAIVGAFAGIAIATAIAPSLLSTQLCGLTSDTETTRPCIATVRDATSGLMRIQGIGALTGAVFGLGVSGAWVIRGASKSKPPTAPTRG